MILSVITAVRNAVSTSGVEALEKCIASVAALGVEHEHIIQDGCSTDGTTAVLADLAKKYVGVKVFTERDTGIYNALNRGVEKAHGDWVYVLGADDYVAKPERLVEAIKRGEDSQAAMVVSPVGVSADLKKRLPVSRTDVFSSMPYPHQGILMRLDVMRRYHGFDEQYRISSDADLVWRMLFAGETVTFYNDPYAYYSLGGFSTGNEKLQDETRAIIMRLHGMCDAEAQRLMSRKLLPLRIIIKSLFHVSPQVRASARYYFGRLVANAFGLIGSNGALKYKGEKHHE